MWCVEVRGKGRGKHGRMVTLLSTSPTLSAMREYLKARQDRGDNAACEPCEDRARIPWPAPLRRFRLASVIDRPRLD